MRGFSAETLWRAALLFTAVSALIVVRACGYDASVPGRYAAYLLAHVMLPGLVAVRFLDARPVDAGRFLALVLPAGFAVESLQFLSLAALGLRDGHAWSPLGWLALLLWQGRAGRALQVRVSAHHAGVVALLALFVTGALALAAGQMFTEAPLAHGVPARGIFHDWVYLISRAAVIKNHWPLEDPSLAGTPLQYHYFMMVHAAAASWATGLEISTVMLRLLYLPLSLALVAQVFLLGRYLSCSVWGGCVACLLFLATSELSFSTSYGDSHYLGLFSRWLFVSPTFFHGMIYAGALLLVLRDVVRRNELGWRGAVFLLLLGVGGTGTKGTVLPVFVTALVVFALWSRRRAVRFPARIIVAAALLGVAFVAVYIPTMSAWRSGGARFNPFHIFEMTGFWREWLPICDASLRTLFPPVVAGAAAEFLCGLVAFAGTCGIRLLALPYLAWGSAPRSDRALARLLGAFVLACVGMGLLLELNSFGEIYVLLMMRLPMSVLAAGFLIGAVRQRSIGSDRPYPVLAARPVLRLAAVAVLVTAFIVQSSVWMARNAPRFTEWLQSPAVVRADADMGALAEAMLWVRSNTERNAVLVANACTPENTRGDHWGALDRTLLGVHFYYSALSERRLWFEGHHYVLNGPLLSRRAAQASDFFYRGGALPPSEVASAPVYVVVDHAMKDEAHRPLPRESRLFSNRRISIYPLPVAAPPRGVEVAALQQD
ncbi:MAG: hypothetical protein ACKOE8_01310 [Opitutaceae bacterium]